jgi:hypothetical protein
MTRAHCLRDIPLSSSRIRQVGGPPRVKGQTRVEKAIEHRLEGDRPYKPDSTLRGHYAQMGGEFYLTFSASRFILL